MLPHDPTLESWRKLLWSLLRCWFLWVECYEYNLYLHHQIHFPLFSTPPYSLTCVSHRLYLWALLSSDFCLFSINEKALLITGGEEGNEVRVLIPLALSFHGFCSIFSSLYAFLFWQFFSYSSLILRVLVTVTSFSHSNLGFCNTFPPVSSPRLHRYFLWFPHTLLFLLNQCFIKLLSNYPIWVYNLFLIRTLPDLVPSIISTITQF